MNQTARFWDSDGCPCFEPFGARFRGRSSVVYNTAINELAGRPLPDYRLLDARYGQRFTPQDVDDWKPLPSGMLRAPQLWISGE